MENRTEGSKERMESTHVISISNGEENIAARENEKPFQFSLTLPPIFCRLRENKILHCSLLRDKQIKQDTKNMIHSVKVGFSLVLISLLYLLDPLYEQVGDNAMWAIMTVIVIFEFSAGATLGKGLNRGMGTILGGGLGCIAAVLAQNLGVVGDSVMIGTSVFIFGMIGTYIRLLPSIKKRYDYGVMIFILTFNLVVVSGVRTDQKVWEIARDRLLSIVMGFIVCICVSLFVFPLWAGDELHGSTVSRFQHLADSFQGCLEHYVIVKSSDEKETQAGAGAPASFSVCKSLLNSRPKDELLVNFAKWEPWHGKFGFCYPWEKYLEIGEVLQELAAIILALGGCLQASKKRMSLASKNETAHLESCEAIGSRVVWALRELGDSMKQMRKYQTEPHISSKLKSARQDISLMISTAKIAAALENSDDDNDALATVSFAFLLREVVDKVEELTKVVDELGDIAGFRAHSTQ